MTRCVQKEPADFYLSQNYESIQLKQKSIIRDE